jgi:choline dehydrogenase
MRRAAGSRISFDYIIVGAGSAGCVLASRLTEDGDTRVLVLESGPADRSWRIEMPSAANSLLASERFSWNYASEPEPYLEGRRLLHPRGRVLGGSSAINGMVYTRGHALDYDGWAGMGLAEWSYASVLPYFKRAEHYSLGAGAYHGDEGPLPVYAPDLERSRTAQAFVRAGEEAGYGLTDDVNGAQQEGFGRLDRTTKDGRRWSAARAYLDPAKQRRNLIVRTGAHVSRVVIHHGRAIGVEYSEHGRKRTAYADGEVILCGGALNSPQLLLLSGVGSAEDMKPLGIETKCHLPSVGKYLTDHPGVVIQHRCPRRVSLYGVNRGVRKWITGARWFMGGRGPAASNHFEAGAFIRSRPGIEYPDLQLTFLPLAFEPGSIRDVGMPSCQVRIDLMRPQSLGRLKLRSANPKAPPSVLFNYLKEPQDRRDLRTAVRRVREILAQPALASCRGEEIHPGPGVQSDEEIDSYIRRRLESGYHPAGTCRMGIDADAVVDEECRVRGVEFLRVVDASIMPSIVSGSLNAPTIMIAEKASDLIRRKLALAPAQGPMVWRRPQRRVANA